MPDLKAAAKWLRETAGKYWTPEEEAYNETAAQALEALAWLKDKDAILQAAWWGDRSDWMVCFDDDEYAADTPLGAILAAMEGEKDGN